MRAIDVHVHPPGPHGGSIVSDPEVRAYFRSAVIHESAEETAAYYAELDIFGVLFHIDSETATGVKPVPNDYIADIV